MSSRGVLYVKWGDERADALQARATESLKRHHPELPVHVQPFPPDSTVLVKSTMFDLSPFDQTLYLDLDTVVMGRLDYAFDRAETFGLACCIAEVPWARRHRGLAATGDLIAYNTGVLFFTRAARPVFDLWRDSAAEIDGTIELMGAGEQPTLQPIDDQASFAAAVDEAGVAPFVLPLNYNFRPPHHPKFFGPIRIYHDLTAPPRELEEWNRLQSEPGAIIRDAGLEPGRT